MSNKENLARSRALIKAAVTVRTEFSRDRVGEILGFRDALAMQVLLQLTLTDGITRKELVEKLLTSQPNISTAVAKLLESGHIVSKTVSSGRRSEMLHLTRSGELAVQTLLERSEPAR